VGVSNQGIELLGSCGSHLEKWVEKWYRGDKRGLDGWVGPLRRRCQMIGTNAIKMKRGIQWGRGQIRVSEKG
jgi:hypothetical protein